MTTDESAKREGAGDAHWCDACEDWMCRCAGQRIESLRSALEARNKALRELVECKRLKDRGWHMRRTGYNVAEIQAVEREYAERKYLAWQAAFAIVDAIAPALVDGKEKS